MRIILFFITITTSILFSQSIANERFNQKCSKYDITNGEKNYDIASALFVYDFYGKDKN